MCVYWLMHLLEKMANVLWKCLASEDVISPQSSNAAKWKYIIFWSNSNKKKRYNNHSE